MKIKKIFINSRYLILLLLTCLLSGCSDDNPVTTSSNINVNGKVVTNDGVPVFNANVIIGSSIATTSADGNFAINNITPPYDIKILTGTKGIVYEGLTTPSPNLNSPHSLIHQNSALLTVQIPNMLSGQRANVFFTDEATVSTVGSIPYPFDTTKLTVRWSGNGNISGKIIVMVNSYSGTSILSYDKYGEKQNYTLNNGASQTAVFSAQELLLNPGETQVAGNAVLQAGYNLHSCYLRIRFDNGSPYHGFTIYSINSTAFIFNVPTGLTTTPQLSVTGIASSMNTFTNNSLIVNPGSAGNILNLETSCVLVSPVQSSTNIDTNTNFIFTPVTGPGIYSIWFESASKSFTVYTTSTDSIKIPNLASYGLGIGANTIYIWYVEKILDFSNIDDFVSKPLYQNSMYKGYSRSTIRIFTTGP